MKRIFVLAVMMLMALGFSMQAQADLQTIGTATYNSSDYNLIYDDDLEITWLDYSNAQNDWDSQVGWASGLNTGGVLTYNFNDGVSMDWGSSVWRLPTTVDGPYEYGYDGTTTVGYNITSSEMGHLFYTELGNDGYYDTDGNTTGCSGSSPYCLTNTGDFQNLQASDYWSGTEYSPNPNGAWHFYTGNGVQYYDYKGYDSYAIAVRPGLAVVPEPMSMVLFGVGGVVMAGRMVVRRRRNLGL